MYLDGFGDFTRLDSSLAIQVLILLAISLVLMPTVLRLFGGVFRMAFILTVLVLPVYMVLPILH
jgi:hypothetical protein